MTPVPSPIVARPAVVEAPKPQKKSGGEKLKNDPKLVAAARELRDRWLEKVNAGEAELAGAGGVVEGKYEISRTPSLPEALAVKREVPLLAA